MNIKFKGCDFEVENPEFRDGYAIVTKELNREDCERAGCFSETELTIKAIVDEHGNEVLQAKGYYEDITQFSDKNFIVTKRCLLDDDGEQAGLTYFKYCHYRINDDGNLKLVEEIKPYRKFYKENIIIKHENEVFVYDFVKQEVCSEKFDTISDYNEETGLAQATRYFDKANFLVCFINKNGKIVTDIYTTVTEEVVNKNDVTNFEEFFEEQNNLLEEKKEMQRLATEELKKNVHN